LFIRNKIVSAIRKIRGNKPVIRGKKGFSKLDPRLNIILELTIDELEIANQNKANEVLFHGIDFSRGIGNAKALVLVTFSENPTSFKKVLSQKYDMAFRGIVNNIGTCTIPLSNIQNLTDEEAVKFIQLSERVFLTLDESVPLIGASSLHQETPEVSGEGVIIGVVDNGLDFYHPDFVVHPDGVMSTRVQSIWIQHPLSDDPRRRPRPWDFGVEYSRDDINSDFNSGTHYSIVPYKTDVDSHGTHVASIATGNGNASRASREVGRIYDGVTTLSDMIFVDPFSATGSPTLVDVLNAIHYIFDKAGDIPCIVNLSLAFYMGPHDGSDLGYIDGLLNEKNTRMVTIGSGNSNTNGKFKDGDIHMGNDEIIEFNVPPSTDSAENIEIWYSGEAELSCELSRPGDYPFRTILRLGETYVLSDPASHTRIHVTHLRQDLNGDNVIRFYIYPLSLSIDPGNWKIKLRSVRGDCKWSGYIDENSKIKWNNPVLDRSTLSNLATCKKAITVGNSGPPNETINPKSGRGPTRDGRIKPEISAPGTDIMSAKSSDHGVPDGYYNNVTGTSFASPHTAGTISLIYEQCINITSEEVKLKLFQMADRTGLVRIEDQYAHGWGRLRVTKICRD
jgi:subtilisin family serine protease